jgi:NAD(P)-dependent dehydrogenase (short-subunit alcohol dehydrogenase family)
MTATVGDRERAPDAGDARAAPAGRLGSARAEPRSHDLAGSRALVTGGGRGLGRAIAQAFAAAGAEVGLLARSSDELAESVELIERAGGVATFAPADVRDEASLSGAIGRLRNRLGPFDVLVNGAGIVGPIGPLWEVDPGDWWQAMEVNVAGLVRCTQLVLPDMVARRRGRVLNLSSQAGVHRWPLVSAYSVSKAAVTKLTENLAREVQRFGVAVFSVHPGLLPIGMGSVPDTRASGTPSPHEDHIWDWVSRALAEGRGASPADAVDLIVRLAAGSADALSGRHISVHDDLDALLAHIDRIREEDLHSLHVRRMPVTGPGLSSLPGGRTSQAKENRS